MKEKADIWTGQRGLTMSKSCLTSLFGFCTKMTGFVDKRAVGCLLPKMVVTPPLQDTDQLEQIQCMATKIASG